MIFAMTNELKSMNRRHDKDREEFRSFRKGYEMDLEEKDLMISILEKIFIYSCSRLVCWSAI